MAKSRRTWAKRGRPWYKSPPLIILRFTRWPRFTEASFLAKTTYQCEVAKDLTGESLQARYIVYL